MVKTTSLWELRKRPLSREASAKQETPRETQEAANTPPSVATDDALDTLLSLRCRYRRDKCNMPRTMKRNGKLHSLCVMHRDRSVANQSRFDNKKRQERQAFREAHLMKIAARREQRRERNKNPDSSEVVAPSTTSQAIVVDALLSFKDGDAQVVDAARVNHHGWTVSEATEDPDGTRAWLLPFPADGNGPQKPDAAWRDAAVAQFLLHQ